MAAPLIPSNWQLPDYFRRRLGSSAGRQRLMQSEGQLLIVVHRVPEPNEVTRRGVLVWFDGQQWRASDGGPGKLAVESLLDVYTKKIEQFDQQEAKAQSAAEYLPLLDGLTPLVRAARNLYEVLQEARTVANEVHELIDWRDRAYDISRTAELLYQDAKNSMELAVVRRAEEQAAASHKMSVSAHRLNTMAAIFFPLATLGSIFGTTFTENWSWSQTTGPFLWFLVVGLVTGFGLAVFVNRSEAA
ncbi:MAG: hypothetical protein IT422_23265 [Pirellulaceae bacterium]|jgi:hypothetical protein|nr:hypothetical protein [Pirellulaceae bacterium]